jgi:hypothetical protein
VRIEAVDNREPLGLLYRKPRRAEAAGFLRHDVG